LDRKERRVLVTGSRDWVDRAAVEQALEEQFYTHTDIRQVMVVVHGDNPTGADAIADDWAEKMAEGGLVRAERHPAEWDADCGMGCPGHRRARPDGSTYCPVAGHLRNQRMVDLGAEVCLAFPLGTSRGTRDCMRRARRAGIRVVNLGRVLR